MMGMEQEARMRGLMGPWSKAKVSALSRSVALMRTGIFKSSMFLAGAMAFITLEANLSMENRPPPPR